MIIGTGIDIVELSRIGELLEKQPKLISRILTENEQNDCFNLKGKRKIEFIAGRFAAKEAFVKAMGTGISAEYGWRDIEVRNEQSGKPYMVVLKSFDQRIHLSISHSNTYAVASVIIESASS